MFDGSMGLYNIGPNYQKTPAGVQWVEGEDFFLEKGDRNEMGTCYMMV